MGLDDDDGDDENNGDDDNDADDDPIGRTMFMVVNDKTQSYRKPHKSAFGLEQLNYMSVFVRGSLHPFGKLS